MTRLMLFPTLALAVGISTTMLAAETDSAQRTADFEASKKKLADQTYRLRYRFAPGESYRTKVVHLVTVETKIQGATETAKTRSVSVKAWKVTDVDGDGNITFTYAVEEASMWQQLSDRQEVRYDSTKSDTPPPEYKHVAESIGVPMASVKIAPSGRILERKNARPQFNPGIGELTVPLPDQPVRVGQSWATDGELAVRMPDKTVRPIMTRQEYTLDSVKTGVAHITVRTQILTPVSDPAVQSQLLQRIKRGEIRFDIDAGRVLSQQMDIDETVIGFRGPDSIMKYLARLTEDMVQQENVARVLGKS
jgi:hypothetical protein